MIRVNLLPEEYRRVERTPPSLFLLIVVGVAVICLGLYYCVGRFMDTTRLLSDLNEKKAEKERWGVEAERARKLDADIANYEKRLDTIKGIRASRIYWSKKLYLLAKDTPLGIWFASAKMEQRDPYPAPIKPEEIPQKLVKEFDKNKDGKVSPDELKAVPEEELRRKVLKDKDGGSLQLQCYQKSYDSKIYADYRSRLRKDRIFYTDFASPGLPDFSALDWDQATEEERHVLFFQIVFHLEPQMEFRQ
jgi:hypothetical protein